MNNQKRSMRDRVKIYILTHTHWQECVCVCASLFSYIKLNKMLRDIALATS